MIRLQGIRSSSDYVLLKVSPWKGIIRFRKRGKLGPRYIGPFRITTRVGKVENRLDLLEELSHIHNTSHVCQLRNCVTDKSTVISLDDNQVDESRNYNEKPVAILGLQNKEIRLVKV